MAVSEEHLEFIREQLHGVGPIQIRRMFGGAGVFCDGLMFALSVDDTLYLKADAATAPRFAAEGQAPFSYQTSGGRNTIMSYWRCPERLLDDPDEMLAWAQRALASARTAAAAKANGRRKAKSPTRRFRRT